MSDQTKPELINGGGETSPIEPNPIKPTEPKPVKQRDPEVQKLIDTLTADLNKPLSERPKKKYVPSLRLVDQKFLLDHELDHLKRILKMFEFKDPRNTLLIHLLLNTGARPGEMLCVRAKDMGNQNLAIPGFKGSFSRCIPLPKWLFKRLQNYVKEHGMVGDDRIFPIALPTLQGVWSRYRPVRKALRSTRHTFALNLFRRTRDIYLVKMALGHKNILNTLTYMEYVYEEEELKRLILED